MKKQIKKTFKESVNQIKQEILFDMKTGIVPFEINSFGALGDYVDHTEYGGFSDVNYKQTRTLEFENGVFTAIDVWLKNRPITTYKVVLTLFEDGETNPEVMDLVNIIDETDRLMAAPDEFNVGDTISEIDIILRENNYVDDIGVNRAYFAHRK